MHNKLREIDKQGKGNIQKSDKKKERDRGKERGRGEGKDSEK